MQLIQAIDWPHITLILGIIFLFLFRREIGNFILRVKRVGRDGVQADNELNPQKTGETTTANILSQIEIEKSVFLKEVEDAIFQDLENKNLDHQSNTTMILVRNLAVTRIYLEHEQTYDSILGSQILFLKRLNEASGLGQDREYIEGFFQDVKIQYPDAFSAWTSDTYTSFLFGRGLIVIGNDKYHITHKGQDFLIWLARSAKREDKPY